MTNLSDYKHLLRFDEEKIPFPPFIEALNAIEANLDLFRNTGIARHLMVLGESGAGKSTLCKYLVAKYPRAVLPERDVLPVLHVPVPPSATISGVASEILIKLGDPAPNTGTVPAKTQRIIALCKGCKVELLLVDEAQQINDRGRQSTQYHVADWIKRLIDDLEIPTVFLGLPRFVQILQVNEQLRRRVSRRLYLALGQTDGVSLETECLQLFMSLGFCLPVPLSYGRFSTSEFSQRLLFASDGLVGYIKDLLDYALTRALQQNLDQITPSELEAAFQDKWPEGVGKLNPFNDAFEFRRLDRAGEPFERGAYASRKAK